jgi:hypothetical protein
MRIMELGVVARGRIELPMKTGASPEPGPVPASLSQITSFRSLGYRFLRAGRPQLRVPANLVREE